MILKRIQTTVGTVTGTNCYIIADETTHEAIVVDPGVETEAVINMLMTLDAKLKYIVLTHCHGDHIAGVNKLKQEYGGKVLIHREDSDRIKRWKYKLSRIY
jgi:glyoxylase-like metal-dependent hydrolase (beta-lactamase superfamily II)